MLCLSQWAVAFFKPFQPNKKVIWSNINFFFFSIILARYAKSLAINHLLQPFQWVVAASSGKLSKKLLVRIRLLDKTFSFGLSTDVCWLGGNCARPDAAASFVVISQRSLVFWGPLECPYILWGGGLKGKVWRVNEIKRRSSTFE